MSLNTAHVQGGGILLFQGERILLYCDNVSLEWSGQTDKVFKKKKQGKVSLTTHRIVFINSSRRDEMRSFSFPYVTLSGIDVEQPIFGANRIKGTVSAQPNGNWSGEAKFKMKFQRGGAIKFGKLLKKVHHLATKNVDGILRLPDPPVLRWNLAPATVYIIAPEAYYGMFVLPVDDFPHMPPSDSVYVGNAAPPYPGI